MPKKRSIVGNLINFRGLVYSPVSEQGVVFLFGKIIEDLNMYIEEIRTAYPDCVGRRYVGRGRWERISIEFEYKSSGFLQHKHDPKQCDIIVCWEHDWEGCPLEVIELKELIKELPTKPLQEPEVITEGVKYELEDLASYKRTTVNIRDTYKQFDEKIKQINEKIWRKISKSAVTYYCPERVFVYLRFQKQGLRMTVFVGGVEIEGVKNYKKHPMWGVTYLRKMDDLDKTMEIMKRSFNLIREAIKNNINTGWYAKLPKYTLVEIRAFKHDEVEFRLSLLKDVTTENARLDLWREIRERLPSLNKNEFKNAKVRDVVTALLENIENQIEVEPFTGICLDMLSIIARRANDFIIGKMKEAFLRRVEKMYEDLPIGQKRDALEILQPLRQYDPKFMENLVLKAIDPNEWNDEEFSNLTDAIDLWSLNSLHESKVKELHRKLWKLKAEAELNHENVKKERIEHLLRKTAVIIS